jgi:hypothetical protein
MELIIGLGIGAVIYLLHFRQVAADDAFNRRHMSPEGYRRWRKAELRKERD